MSLSALRASIAASERQRALSSFPPAVPLPAQRRLIEAAVASARRALRLPDFRIVCVAAGRTPPTNGETVRAPDGIGVYLNMDCDPDELRRVTWHECQHVADCHAGLELSRLELEQRACAFVWRMERRVCEWDQGVQGTRSLGWFHASVEVRGRGATPRTVPTPRRSPAAVGSSGAAGMRVGDARISTRQRPRF